MNESDIRQFVLDTVDSIEERSGDLRSVKKRGGRFRVGARVTKAALGAVAVAALLGVFLSQSPRTAIAADSYPPDQEEQLISCISEFGFESIPQGDGSLWIDHSDAEREKVREAIGVCTDRVEGRSAASEPEVRAEYEARLAEWECLVDAGYEVAAPPSLEIFVAQYGDGDQSNDWLPIEHVADEAPHEALHGALDACR